MKRIGMLFLIAWLAVTASASAVDVKGKDTSKVVPPKTTQSKGKKTDPAATKSPKTAKPSTKQGTTQSAQKKYDDFIDNNHNGIDDRKENLVKKEDK